MLVTNRYLAAIEVNGNPCLRNPKGKKGLEMMESMLNRRSVTSNHDGLWDGVIDLVEEWRGEGSHSFFEVGEVRDGAKRQQQQHTMRSSRILQCTITNHPSSRRRKRRRKRRWEREEMTASSTRWRWRTGTS